MELFDWSQFSHQWPENLKKIETKSSISTEQEQTSQLAEEV